MLHHRAQLLQHQTMHGNVGADNGGGQQQPMPWTNLLQRASESYEGDPEAEAGQGGHDGDGHTLTQSQFQQQYQLQYGGVGKGKGRTMPLEIVLWAWWMCRP
jgi:hypothetical protein